MPWPSPPSSSFQLVYQLQPGKFLKIWGWYLWGEKFVVELHPSSMIYCSVCPPKLWVSPEEPISTIGETVIISGEIQTLHRFTTPTYITGRWSLGPMLTNRHAGWGLHWRKRMRQNHPSLILLSFISSLLWLTSIWMRVSAYFSYPGLSIKQSFITLPTHAI